MAKAMTNGKVKEKEGDLVIEPKQFVTQIESITDPDVSELLRANPTAAAQLSAIIWKRMFMELQTVQNKV